MRALVRTCGIVLVLVACSFASSRAASDDLVVSIAPSSDQPPPIAKIAPESTSRAGRPKSPIDDRASTMTAAAETAGTTPGTFSVDAFQNDLFTGAATAEIPIVVPAGAAGVAPKIALRYSSGAVDELGERDQAQSAGLGWLLDVGGFILRDIKNSTATSDDTFKLVFGGGVHDLVLVDGAQRLYHTKDEAFLKIQYFTEPDDYWVLTTKDGIQHRFGYTADGKAVTRGTDLVTAITYRYLLDRVTTPSGVAVQYAYTKQTGTIASTGNSYDQAVYPATVTWAHADGSTIGAPRQVTFGWTPRADWTDTSASTILSFFEKNRLETIEVRVGGSLVRRYVLASDYSIDRAPGHSWGGGATGDLTLKTITLYGSDGASTLPPLGFAYTEGRLSTASNGIGGTVSFTYERVAATAVLYNGCLLPHMSSDEFPRVIGCSVWGALWYPDPYGFSTGGGYVTTTDILGPQALYHGCLGPSMDEWGTVVGCQLMGGRTSPDPWGFSNFRGYAGTANPIGTRPLYEACYRPMTDEYGNALTCLDWALAWTPDPWGLSTLAGYAHVGRTDRYRVTSRSLGDGRGTAATRTFSYIGFGLSPDGKDFRGHHSVRAVDPLGHSTDTWFNQDDLLKGRPYHSQTRHSNGSLLAETTNTWATASPYPGVSHARLVQTDVATCDDTGSSCRTARQSFEYDAYGNPTRLYRWGDVARSGDEIDERTDWVVDPATWIHRPNRFALYDAAGATLRERWLAYDGLGWGLLGSRGLLTRDESRLAGGQGSAGNPAVTSAYDGYGNRIAITDPRGCTTTITYESSSQVYPARVTSCLGHATTLAYDARWGERIGETDPNDRTTTYVYDAFGRLAKITGPLDGASLFGSERRVYLDFGNPAAQRIRTYRTTVHGTSYAIWSDSYFDGLGRAYLIQSSGPGTQIIQSEATYDARGLITAQSAPHLTTESAAVTRFTYDASSRQTQALAADGTSVRSAYAPGLVVLTDQRGNVKRRLFDVHGRLTRVEEVNGLETNATTYAYDGAGALVRVTNALGHVTNLTYDLVGRRIATSDPNVGTTTYSYDLGGNLIGQTDARHQTLTFTYDLLGRRLTRTHPGLAEVQWTYDDPAVANGTGRVTQVADASTLTTFGYDAMGRVVELRRRLDATTYTMFLGYNALGQVVMRTFPDGEVVPYSFNEAGWLAAIPGWVSSIAYNARGQQTELRHANGVTSTWTYHPTNFRLTGRTTAGAAGPLQSLAYASDAAGNVTQIQDALFTGSRTFTYDALNRLTSASGGFGGGGAHVSQSYHYDAIGNLVEKAGVLYTYGDPLHPSAVTSRTDGLAYTYDANGNMVTGGGRALVWDPDNRLSAVTVGGGTSVTFAYDPNGVRVRKATSAGVTRYPFPDYEIDPYGVVTKYVGGVAKRSTGATFYYHNDHLGGVNVVTDGSGAPVQLVEYDPWGQVSRAEGDADLTHRFTGKELDPETGLYYYGGRYHDAVLGRFVSADPFVPAPGNPQALNRYSYVVNNPVNLVDPSGFFFEQLWRAIRKWARGNELLSSMLGLNLMVMPLPESQVAGVAMLSATETGRHTLAAAIIAGTAVATFYCGGCGVAVGALVGEVGGLYSAARDGGDILTGVVVGGAAGAATGYLGEYLVTALPDGGWSVNAGRWAVEGAGQGIAAGYAGGRGNLQSILLASAVAAATSVALQSAYYGLVDYDATLLPGGPTVPKDALGVPQQGTNNVLFATATPGSTALSEGSLLSRVLNRIPGINSTAGFHDMLMVRLELVGVPSIASNALLVPTVFPSAALSYGALLPGMPTTETAGR
ncbi:MAG: hypothetical protein DMD94_06785 [Candidatus Rokuibacteriota bacterium]|nr:MAG: hypothetical protein DMD94_06785 [Candidatus Rokubacteria bacterium]